MNKRHAGRIAGLLTVAAAAAWALFAVPADTPTAAAEACPDVGLVFARGTGEAPGVGGTGQAFVDSLRAQTEGKSVGVYAVDYPASKEYANSIAAGANDASSHVQSMATTGPNTKIVLGG